MLIFVKEHECLYEGMIGIVATKAKIVAAVKA